MADNQDLSSQAIIFKDAATQKMLNEPMKLEGGLTPENEQFLDAILMLVQSGKINLYAPSSLMNEPFYNTLDESTQGKADLEAINLLSAIREIKNLIDAGYRETYQIEYLVDKLRKTKERIELAGGDLFII